MARADVASRYMAWAKQIGMTPCAYELTGSGMPSLSWHDLDDRDLPLFVRHFYGAPGLREVIGQLHGASADQVLLAGGTSTANFLIAMAALEPGDTVVIEAPVYEPLAKTFELAGARLVELRRPFEARFQPEPGELDRLIDGAKMVVLSNLHNPTGVALERGRLEAIAATCAKHGVTLLVDEVYLDFTDPVQHAPIGDHVVVTASLTKVYGLTGLRMGWAVGPKPLIDRAWKVKDCSTVLDPYPLEVLGERLLRDRERYRTPVRQRADAHRELLMAWARSEDLAVVEPAGGIIAAVKLPDGMSAHALNDHLVTRQQTRVVPGDFFGMPGFIRVGFGGDTDVVREGLRRVAAGIRALAEER